MSRCPVSVGVHDGGADRARTVAMAAASVLSSAAPADLTAIIVAATLFGAAYIGLTGPLLLCSVRL